MLILKCISFFVSILPIFFFSNSIISIQVIRLKIRTRKQIEWPSAATSHSGKEKEDKKEGGKKKRKRRTACVRQRVYSFLVSPRHNLFVQPEDLLRSATDARVIFFKRVNLASRVSTRIFSNEKRDSWTWTSYVE